MQISQEEAGRHLVDNKIDICCNWLVNIHSMLVYKPLGTSTQLFDDNFHRSIASFVQQSQNKIAP